MGINRLIRENDVQPTTEKPAKYGETTQDSNPTQVSDLKQVSREAVATKS